MLPDSSSMNDGQGAGGVPPWMTSFLGLSSIFAALGMVSQTYLGSSIKLLILGSIIETGRRVFQWLIVRLRFQYSITAQFNEGDPAYEWILLFLTQENVWQHSRDFVVNATNSQRKWSVKTWADPKIKGNAEYVPTYSLPQLFRWRGRWLEIKRSREGLEGRFIGAGMYRPLSSIFITVYTLDMSLISALVEDARVRYMEINRPNVIIHLADSPHYGPGLPWTSVKHKIRRPLSSIIMPDGVVDTLVRDAQEFISSEDWYVEAGIPHRRGYLLYGPPGTGKTSTIYALAGELNVEIYSLSLASSFVDDAFLQRAASAIPKNAIFLIEDIDCAFPSRDDEEDASDAAMALYGAAQLGSPVMFPGMPSPGRGIRSLVTLSGLLNVIDGVGSEEGKLFFATTNYIDRLDPALLRPGRIDRKVQYELATLEQARALFMRFFPEARFPEFASPAGLAALEGSSKSPEDQAQSATSEIAQARSAPATPLAPTSAEPASEQDAPTIATLAAAFAAAVPQGELSTAELQCYLQAHKFAPREAAAGVGAWVAEVRAEREARKGREEERERKARARREKMMQEGAGMVRGREQTDAGAGASATSTKAERAEEREASPVQGSGSEFSSYGDGALPEEN